MSPRPLAANPDGIRVTGGAVVSVDGLRDRRITEGAVVSVDNPSVDLILAALNGIEKCVDLGKQEIRVYRHRSL